MLNRNVSLVVCLSVISGAAFAQSNQGTGYIFEFANSSGVSGQFQGFVYNAASLGSPTFSNAGPAGATQVIAKPDGSQFYMFGTSGLVTYDPAFATSKNINGITGTPTQAVMSNDGRYLLLAASQGGGASNVYLINTSTNTVSLNQPVTGSVVGMIVSRDSQTAWVMYTSSQAFIMVLNLAKQAESGTGPIVLRDPQSGNSLGQNATSFTMSPLGLLYVTAGNTILEIDPASLQTCLTSPQTCSPVTANTSVNATPGPLQFTPDGTEAYFVNETPAIGGQALLRMTLPSHAIISWPPFVAGQQIEAFDSILVASSTRIFAHSPADSTLWDVAPDFSTVAESTLQSVAPATGVLAIAISNELPAAHYLFTLVGNGSIASLYRIDLTTNTVTSQTAAALGQGVLQFVYVPQENNPSAFLTFNNPQTVAAGATAAQLIARVLDAAGRPVFAVPVTFTGDSSLTFKNVSAITDQNGYAVATVTLGQSPGSFPVTLTAGTGSNVATTTFALTIPGAGGGTGPGNGPNQMSIVSGNGQLFQAGFAHVDAPPLTVLVVDGKGNPLPNQDVTFQVTGPQIAALDNPNTTTDQNGLAYTDFYPQQPAQNTPFEATTVTASSTLGSVNFIETIFQPDQGILDQPTATVQAPVNSTTITAGEGDVLPEAILVAIFSHSYGASQPIPNVAIRIADANNPQNNGPATCQGNPVSDQTGTIHCALIASCSAGLGLHGFSMSIGEDILFTDYAVNIVPGSQQTLTIPANNSGNGQSGKPGAQLQLPLTAIVADQCGSPIQGATVTWKVTQGAATLSATSTVSNQGGTVSNHLTLGSAAAGAITIVATLNATTAVTYTVSASAVVGSLIPISGGGQTALINQPFAKPLIFQLSDINAKPLPNLTVNFAVLGGAAALNVTSASTNAQGQVAVSVTAGSSAGVVTVQASYATFNATQQVTVTAPGPGVTASGFVNAASLQSGLVPCGLSSVTGTALTQGVNGVVLGNPLGIGPLPYTLAGVTITVDGVPAPLLSASNQNGVQQVNFQTPCETPVVPATVVVQVGATTTTVPNVTVYPAQPGIFTYAGPSGIAYGWIINASNGSYLSPSNLATAGQTYYLVATGLGQTTPSATTNAPGTGSQAIPVSNLILAINNVGVPVTSVQYLEGAIGEYVITFTIPTLANGAPFPTGSNLPISLGVIAGGQTIYDTAPVAIPGIK